MKLKFKVQEFQTRAVESVVDCFKGQANASGIKYRIDPGVQKDKLKETLLFDLMKQQDIYGFKNSDLTITEQQLLQNIQDIQKLQNIPVSDKLISSAGCRINLDVEMETGTGKTYCYIKTIFEMNRKYGWSKFIVVVPSIAIREGVFKSFEITADHFAESYHRKARFFIYNSRHPHNLESFASDAGINVMIINIQAFNATGKDNRRIFEELDDFQSRRPIDVLSATRPILILDEPQKMEGDKTVKALAQFKPMMILRYSATHRKNHNKVHRLDALDAYNQKLVKKIAVRGISVKGLSGSVAYLYLDSIEVSKQAPIARMEIEIKQAEGIKRKLRKFGKGDNLYDISGLDQYRDFVIVQIDAINNTVEFKNGQIIEVGEVSGDVNETALRRIQIRETIKAHLEKERLLFFRGIKTLSLFFIDAVNKYRDYDQPEDKGEYARIFEEEYKNVRDEMLGELPFDETADYRKYLEQFDPKTVHQGYFSIDKKSKRLIDPKIKKTGEMKGQSDDVDAYDLILKNKEKLLSFEEPVRFIFSHSALREGWDNPNVFTMCMLKHSDSTISRRQEVGRGLRLSVNQAGERIDDRTTVHDINILTVVANESYTDFVSGLQHEIRESLSERPTRADEAYFIGKTMGVTDGKAITVDENTARQIHRYLIKNDYVDDRTDEITPKYRQEQASGNLAPMPEELQPYTEHIVCLINSVLDPSALPEILDETRQKVNPLNSNFHKKEFQELWRRINSKAVYRVEFDTTELINNCIKAINLELRVSPLQYSIQTGSQVDKITDDLLKEGRSFVDGKTRTETHEASIHSAVKYDLIGNISENTQLKRETIARILQGVYSAKFDLFKRNPEHFISETSRLIKEQKATTIIERLTYDSISACHDTEIFTAGQHRQDISKAVGNLQKHVYDYAITDSNTEKEFVRHLDNSEEVVVYAKLPRGFFIPTPVGDYNPDWAISFREGTVKHIYFIAETKGSMSTLQLKLMEEKKIECARKFFEALNRKYQGSSVKYDVVDSFGRLMEVVGGNYNRTFRDRT